MQTNEFATFAEIPPGFLSQYASMLSNEGKVPSTVKVYVFAVKKYLDWVRLQSVKVEFQAKVDLPKVNQKVRPVLPADKMTDFFRYVDMELDEPTRSAVMLLPCCGLRATEMVSLRLLDINKARVRLKNGSYKTTLFFTLKGKGDKERNVPLMEEGVEILTGYLAGWRKRRAGPWLFPTPSPRGSKKPGRRHITDRLLRDGVEKVRDLVGMKFTPQTFRRTYVTALYNKGVDVGVIADVVGHSNIQTTYTHYIKMDPQKSLEAVHNAGASLMEG